MKIIFKMRSGEMSLCVGSVYGCRDGVPREEEHGNELVTGVPFLRHTTVLGWRPSLPVSANTFSCAYSQLVHTIMT